MILIDKSSIGPCVIYCAPKTGCASITEIASRNSHGHHRPQDWHQMSPEFMEGRTPALMVRDPRERILSLWRHYCREEKTEIGLEDFMKLQRTLKRFYKTTLCSFYQHAIKKDFVTIRTEHFHGDLSFLFRWEDKIHQNKTKHEPWTMYREIFKDYEWWKEDAETFKYME